MPDFQFGIEDDFLATSVYRHPGSGEILFWVRVGRSIFEVPNEQVMDDLIDILQHTKQETLKMKGETND